MLPSYQGPEEAIAGHRNRRLGADIETGQTQQALQGAVLVWQVGGIGPHYIKK